MTIGQNLELSGWSGSHDYFSFREIEGFDPEAAVDVLYGRVLGVVFRQMVPRHVCDRLTDGFSQSSARRARGADAPGFYIGSYHYHKTTDDYLGESAAARAAVDEVLGGDDDPLAELRAGLAEVLGRQGVRFRLAEHHGRQAGRAILRSWHGQSDFALDPHEDLGQCVEPKQAGFEIQRAAERQIVALNMCLSNGRGGQLVVWNIRPDEASRRRLGLYYTGSPYPLDQLSGVELTRLDIGPGDVYVFNGSHVHAVEPESDPTARRVTLSCFLGFIDDQTVVSWT